MTENKVKNTAQTKYGRFSPEYIACIPEHYNKVFVECENDFQMIFFQRKGKKELYCCSPMTNRTNSIIYYTVSMNDNCVSLQKAVCLEKKYNFDYALFFLEQEETIADSNVRIHTTDLIENFNTFCNNLEEKKIEVKKITNKKVYKVASTNNESKKIMLSCEKSEETNNEITAYCSIKLVGDKISIEHSFPSDYYGKMSNSYKKMLKILEKQCQDIDFIEDDITKNDINNLFDEIKSLKSQSLQSDLNKKSYPKTIIKL